MWSCIEKHDEGWCCEMWTLRATVRQRVVTLTKRCQKTKSEGREILAKIWIKLVAGKFGHQIWLKTFLRCPIASKGAAEMKTLDKAIEEWSTDSVWFTKNTCFIQFLQGKNPHRRLYNVDEIFIDFLRSSCGWSGWVPMSSNKFWKDLHRESPERLAMTCLRQCVPLRLKPSGDSSKMFQQGVCCACRIFFLKQMLNHQMQIHACSYGTAKVKGGQWWLTTKLSSKHWHLHLKLSSNMTKDWYCRFLTFSCSFWVWGLQTWAWLCGNLRAMLHWGADRTKSNFSAPEAIKIGKMDNGWVFRL